MQTDRGCAWQATILLEGDARQLDVARVPGRWAQVRGPAYIRRASSQPQRDIGLGEHGPGDWGVWESRVLRVVSRGRGGGGVVLLGGTLGVCSTVYGLIL